MPPDNRELVFCHSCEEEWYRDQHGLVCPRCNSDIVEIIDPGNDPRAQEQDLLDIASLHDHRPWGDPNAPDPDEEDISNTPFRSDPSRGRAPTQMANPFDHLNHIFGTLAASPPGGTTQRWHTTTSSGGIFTGSTHNGGFSVQWSSGGIPRGGMQSGNDDLAGIFEHLSHIIGAPMQPPGSPQRGPGPAMHPLFQMLVGGLPGRNGDFAYTQEGFDRILTMLREQHGGSEGAPPATEEAIAALPKVNISKEHLDEQGKAECSICMDQVAVGDEVTMLPCDHWFHGECIKSWLKEHDTCPQCRRGITPRDGNQNQPRTTGQAPRNWQVNENDLHGIFGQQRQRGEAGAETNNGGPAPSSPRSPASTGFSAIANATGNLFRRLTNPGSSNNTSSGSYNPTDNNNNAGGASGNNSRQ